MVEERVTRGDASGEGAHTHTTVVTDHLHRSGGSTIIIVLVLVELAFPAFL